MHMVRKGWEDGWEHREPGAPWCMMAVNRKRREHWRGGRQTQTLQSWEVWAIDLMFQLILELQISVQVSLSWFYVEGSIYCSSETLEPLEKEELLYPSQFSLFPPPIENIRFKILMQSRKRIKSGSTPFASFSGRSRVPAFPIISPKWLNFPQVLSTHWGAGLESGFQHSCQYPLGRTCSGHRRKIQTMETVFPFSDTHA